uniref:NADH-ubiquinone oxidoreductase chain 4 n=1 Tax=Cerastoderma edule TaxID=55710 RepID=A0A343F4E9_CERED|nr:NADH dehydrogenase subunit 4 [Cerastoderma edule]ASQ40447.1 NADH dehydrogenase subunit 4 [Cerastoderma edule]
MGVIMALSCAMPMSCWPTFVISLSLSIILMSCLGAPSLSLISWWGHVDHCSALLGLLCLFVGLGSLVCTTDTDSSLLNMIMASTISSVLFFFMSGMILFFVFFEAGLIPLAIMILGWGHQPERLQACVSFALYTVVGSLPMLVIICWVWSLYKSDSMVLIQYTPTLSSKSTMFWLMLITCFFIKLPVFGVHGWLPKAHVEAPVAGSMILAGVLLKFGGYGLMKMLSCFKWDSNMLLSEVIMAVSVWGALCSAMICAVQSDLKSLIAYSSVSHMGLVVVGVFSCSGFGWCMALLMMVAHGLSSPALFAMANFTFNVFHSRSLMVCKGVLTLFPIMATLWFIGAMMSMGLPPGSTFFSEVFLLSSGCSFSLFLSLPMGLLCFASAVYSFFLYSSVCHGGCASLNFSSPDVMTSLSVMTLFMGNYFLLWAGFMLDLFYFV